MELFKEILIELLNTEKVQITFGQFTSRWSRRGWMRNVGSNLPTTHTHKDCCQAGFRHLPFKRTTIE